MKSVKQIKLIKKPTKINIDGNIIVADKGYITDKYSLFFNTKTGVEILDGPIIDLDTSYSLIYPSMIDIGIMGHCKNKCSFCYQGDKNEPNMTLNNFKKIIDQSKELIMQVALGGRGDPNHHENFREIIEYCRENNVIPNYTTSGIALTDEQIEISKLCGAIAVSAYDQTYTFSAIKRLQDAGIKTNIHFLFSSSSYLDAANLIYGYDIWDKKVDLERLNAVIFLLFKPQGKGKEVKFLIPKLLPHLKTFVNALDSSTRTNKFKIGMDSCLFNKISEIRPLTDQEKIFGDTCEAARCSCYITPDMRFMPCSFADHNLFGYDISQNDISDIWKNGNSFLEARKQLKIKSNKCPYGL